MLIRTFLSYPGFDPFQMLTLLIVKGCHGDVGRCRDRKKMKACYGVGVGLREARRDSSTEIAAMRRVPGESQMMGSQPMP